MAKFDTYKDAFPHAKDLPRNNRFKAVVG
jgi:hypothetical protein